jgi:putative chitinase
MAVSISVDLMNRMWPHGDVKIPGLRAGIAASSARVFAKYGIASVLDVTHIMTQMSHECGAGHDVVENLSYSATRMPQVWPSRFPSVASALPYANNPKKLANKVYNGRMGNRVGSDDGYDFRGRGGPQTTGREGYERLVAKTGRDVVNNPDMVNEPDFFLECMVADFINCGCLPYCAAKPGLPDGDIRGVTHHLNGGYIGLSQRQAWFAKWKAALRAVPAATPVAAPVDDGEPSQEEVAAAEPAEIPDDGILRYGRGHDAPDFEVKALQGQLVGLGYQVGSQDGEFGGGTRAALLAFQADNGLPTTGEVDPATKAALKTAPPKPISEKRADATAGDLRAGGSLTVQAADHLTFWGKILATFGIGGGAAQKTGLLDTVQAATDHASTIRTVVENVQDVGTWALSYWWVFAAVGGFFAVKFGGEVIKRRLADHRSATNMSQ